MFPQQSLVGTLLLSLVPTFLFSRTGGVLSYLNFLTYRLPRFPPKNLCSNVMLAVFSSRLHCNGHSLLLSSYLFRIGRIKNPSCNACGHAAQNTSHLILHCAATNSLRRSLFGSFLSLYDLCSRPWVVSRLLGLHGLPPSAHPSEGSGNNNSKTEIADALLRCKGS